MFQNDEILFEIQTKEAIKVRLNEMRELAQRTLKRSQVGISGCRNACALLVMDKDGTYSIFEGCNIELSTSTVMHGERMALFHAILHGFTRPIAIVLATEGDKVAPMCGYCLPPEQEVITYDGLKPIKDIRIGDKVLTHEGRFKKVINTLSRNYEGDLITITTKGSNNEFKTTTTPEHPYITRHLGWYNSNDNHGLKLKQFTETKAENMLIYKQQTKHEYIVFPRIKETVDIKSEDMDMMKIYGYYLAEGSISYEKRRGIYRVVFTFGKSQKEYEYASELMMSLRNKNMNPFIFYKEGWKVQINSVKLSRLINKEFGRYSYGKKIPTWVKLLPTNKLHILLDCYLNGDGSKRVDKRGYYSITAKTASKQLILDLRDIGLKLGYSCSLSCDKNPSNVIMGRQVNTKPHYRISFNKKSSIRRDIDYVYLATKKIEKTHYSGKVYDLIVEDDHTFCTPYHTIHNCRQDYMYINTQLKIYPLDKEGRIEGIYTLIDTLINPYMSKGKIDHDT